MWYDKQFYGHGKYFFHEGMGSEFKISWGNCVKKNRVTVRKNISGI